MKIQTKFEEIQVKREDKRELVLRNEKTQEYLRRIKFEEINERFIKIDQMK